MERVERTDAAPLTRALLRELAPHLEGYRMTLELRCECKCDCHLPAAAPRCGLLIRTETLDCDRGCRASHLLGSDCHIDGPVLAPSKVAR